MNRSGIEYMVWRAEVEPDELPTSKQKMIATWNKLQGMAIAYKDFNQETKSWMYEHPEETRKVIYALAAGALGITIGFAVVYGTEWLSNLKISK